jgi:Ca2+-transporting ATPase
MAEQITKVGCSVALFLFIVLFVKFLALLRSNPDAPAQKAQDFLQIVIVAIAIIVIAVPEGLPLAVTLALAFAMTRMFKENNLVRILSSCETMGNATAICSDKTGTLTTNKMTVVAGCLGPTYKFGVLEEMDQPASGNPMTLSIGKRLSYLSPEVRTILLQSIAINSTAFEGEEDGKLTFIGSKTETALLSFAKDYLAMGPVSKERANANIIQVFPFDSSRKCMATVVRLPDSTCRMFVKGASEVLLEKCTQTIVDVTTTIKTSKLTKDNYNLLDNVIAKYGTESLRTISIVYRDFRSWPPRRTKVREDNSEVLFEDVFQEMVFLGVVGIQDPLRQGAKDAVKKCQDAGVFVRMVTGDNVRTAKAIAKECGIYTDGGIILEGPEFRKLPSAKMDEIIPQLQVLARSSPEDKRILVRKLRDLGEVVAVTGDGTNDGPALRAADVGFSMNSGTEVAKEASSIILMDDNFSSIVNALEWGRAVNDAVRKFLQVGFPFRNL